jgi:phosphoglycerate dehydrogenase-like enzyme
MQRRRILIGYEFHNPDGSPAEALDPQMIARLHAVDPDAEVVYAPIPYHASMQARLRSERPEQLLDLKFPAAYLDALGDAEVLFTLFAPVDLLSRAPRLRWVANVGSGTDQYQAHGILASNVMLSSAKGVAARSIAEFAMSQLLVLARNWPARLDNQRHRRWQSVASRSLDTQTLGIIGLGSIGMEAARMAKAFGMRVIALRRRAGDGGPDVDQVFAADALHDMLGRSDAVLISIAYTAQTAGLFNRAAFEAMRPGGWLLNVSRGGLVDEAALADALNSGQLAAAAFDVFAQEPLPDDSPLWSLPNLLISCHNAVGLDNHGMASFGRFVDELARYVRNEPLVGRVDPAVGY